jgi:hypothetical protein
MALTRIWKAHLVRFRRRRRHYFMPRGLGRDRSSETAFVDGIPRASKRRYCFPIPLQLFRWHLGVCLICTLCAGCAGINYDTITSDAQDVRAKGLRYYDSSPYLLVQTDNQGALKAELKYLPDLTKKRQASPYTFLSSNTTTLDFQSGVVTSTVSDVDASAVPVAVVTALKSVATEAVKMMFDDSNAAEEAPPNRVPKVYLFKIVKRDYLNPKDGIVRREWGLIGASGSAVAYKKEE